MSHGLLSGCHGIGDSHNSREETVQAGGRLSPDYAELVEAGLKPRLQALVARDRILLIIGLSPGQRHDAPSGLELLRRIGPASRQPFLVMDPAYEDDATRRQRDSPTDCFLILSSLVVFTGSVATRATVSADSRVLLGRVAAGKSI